MFYPDHQDPNTFLLYVRNTDATIFSEISHPSVEKRKWSCLLFALVAPNHESTFKKESVKYSDLDELMKGSRNSLKIQ